MKKGLSVLLIAAALFGFYGGAVNLNDVLACKDYWEEKGEQTTADLNKLEDGINQLKDNEQAYLDGVEAVAKGEKDLAKGEADYAAGQAELAKGEAEYAAAPGKLAAGEAQVAAGEAKLAESYKSYNEAPAKLGSIKTLIDGLQKVKRSYEQSGGDGVPSWKDGFEHKASNQALAQAAAGKQTKDTPGLNQAKDLITKTVNTDSNKASIALIEQLSGTKGLVDGVNSAKTYKGFDREMKNMISAFDVAIKQLQGFASTASSYANNSDLSAAAAGLNNAPDMNLTYMTGAAADLEGKIGNMETAGYDKLPAEDPRKQGYDTAVKSLAGLKQLIGARAAVQSKIGGIVNSETGKKLAMIKNLGSDGAKLYAGIEGAMNVLAANSESTTNGDYAKAISSLQTYLGMAADALNGKVKEAQSSRKSFDDWRRGYTRLRDGQSQLVAGEEVDDQGLRFAFAQILANKELREPVEKTAPSLIPLLKLYSTPTVLFDEDLDDFNEDMDKICGTVIPNLVPILRQVYGKGLKTYEEAPALLAEGEEQLAAGKAELAQGYADYAAAPGKLAAGRKQLAEGLQKLMDGRKELADGKEKLAEYEDGEQQVRDGLATLVGTKPDGGLTSILDRLDGDDNFNDKAGHLVLDEGLGAVTVGREYQSDSGELVTEEITKRAVGTGVGLGAAALAVLAGILSLLKKNKGAGIAAILTAAAGAAGIAVGTGSGMEFSHIAGSNMGSMPWVAAGILAGVAAVHAIVHFMQKKEEVDA